MSLAKTITIVSLGIVFVATAAVLLDRLADRAETDEDALHEAIEDRLISLEAQAAMQSNGVLAG